MPIPKKLERLVPPLGGSAEFIGEKKAALKALIDLNISTYPVNGSISETLVKLMNDEHVTVFPKLSSDFFVGTTQADMQEFKKKLEARYQELVVESTPKSNIKDDDITAVAREIQAARDANLLALNAEKDKERGRYRVLESAVQQAKRKVAAGEQAKLDVKEKQRKRVEESKRLQAVSRELDDKKKEAEALRREADRRERDQNVEPNYRPYAEAFNERNDVKKEIVKIDRIIEQKEDEIANIRKNRFLEQRDFAKISSLESDIRDLRERKRPPYVTKRENFDVIVQAYEAETKAIQALRYRAEDLDKESRALSAQLDNDRVVFAKLDDVQFQKGMTELLHAAEKEIEEGAAEERRAQADLAKDPAKLAVDELVKKEEAINALNDKLEEIRVLKAKIEKDKGFSDNPTTINPPDTLPKVLARYVENQDKLAELTKEFNAMPRPPELTALQALPLSVQDPTRKIIRSGAKSNFLATTGTSDVTGAQYQVVEKDSENYKKLKLDSRRAGVTVTVEQASDADLRKLKRAALATNEVQAAVLDLGVDTSNQPVKGVVTQERDGTVTDHSPEKLTDEQEMMVAIQIAYDVARTYQGGDIKITLNPAVPNANRADLVHVALMKMLPDANIKNFASKEQVVVGKVFNRIDSVVQTHFSHAGMVTRLNDAAKAAAVERNARTQDAEKLKKLEKATNPTSYFRGRTRESIDKSVSAAEKELETELKQRTEGRGFRA